MIGIDEVNADGGVAQLDFTGARISQFDVGQLHDRGIADRIEADDLGLHRFFCLH